MRNRIIPTLLSRKHSNVLQSINMDRATIQNGEGLYLAGE